MLFHRLKKQVICVVIACMQLAPFSQAMSQTLAPVPPNISTATAKPMMMIAASRDQTLFGPAYTDFEDVDGDDVVDFTFKPDFSYYGYFDSGKCYNYSTTNSRFEPAIAAVTQTDGRITCASGGSYWAGNFLNWATMTRIDVVRKMLYGGKRSTDTVAATVLERANLSQDAHSFAKFYSGTDIRDYTPYSTANLTKTTGANANVYAGLTICSRSNTSGSGGTPVIRLAKGNYELWATTAGSVCRWGGGTENGPGFAAKVTTVYGTATLGAAPKKHETAAPTTTTDGATYGSTIGPELNVRVLACNSTLLGDERCQPYGTSTVVYKPIGLLQEFGVSATGGSAKAEFGMITGSYDSNIEAGALRKNMETFDAEIDLPTGRFCHITGAITGSCAANYKGGIAAMDALQLYGAGNYNGNNGLDFALPDEMTNGLFPAWGNPMGEMVLQAIRYYAGLPVTTLDQVTGVCP
ncbi:MAG: pilus assembly protein PilY, partial [Polaromonas sp.]|nr:pilus assembly protein PilY [Polaromonas sp.]